MTVDNVPPTQEDDVSESKIGRHESSGMNMNIDSDGDQVHESE